jgi:hypothetical protein
LKFIVKSQTCYKIKSFNSWAIQTEVVQIGNILNKYYIMKILIIFAALIVAAFAQQFGAHGKGFFCLLQLLRTEKI